MTSQLRVHPSFFKEFATKTWVSPNEIVKELIENAFDEDANRVLVTLLNSGAIIIEDDAGMDQTIMEKFLLLGSPHKKDEYISPKYKRIRTGRYGTGRLSFLTSFENMRIRTRRSDFTKSILIDESTLDRLYSGNVTLQDVEEVPLNRNGTELYLSGPKVSVDENKLIREIRKLVILRHPMFEVYFKVADNFREWDFEGAQMIKAPDIQGHRIPVNLSDGKIRGEIVIARRPLSDDERGIAILVGNHIVTRTNFGFDGKLSRVTGHVRSDHLTSRFADKSALIEDEEYTKFNETMKSFIIATVLPSLTQYEDVLITREESKIYREIDKVLGQALIETSEVRDEIQEYRTLDITEVLEPKSKDPGRTKANPDEISIPSQRFEERSGTIAKQIDSLKGSSSITEGKFNDQSSSAPLLPGRMAQDENDPLLTSTSTYFSPSDSKQYPVPDVGSENFEIFQQTPAGNMVIRTRKIRTPVVKKTFALKRVGYKVIPYEDESDARYSFTSDNVVFVNKANSTYKAEAIRGDEFLLRHIISIVAEVVTEAKHPEAKEALELQNRLVAEAIRIHARSTAKK